MSVLKICLQVTASLLCTLEIFINFKYLSHFSMKFTLNTLCDQGDF